MAFPVTVRDFTDWIKDAPMPDTMEHELMRFNTMTFDQLRTRLGKITKSIKLDNFIYVCNKKIIEYSTPGNQGRRLQYESLRALAIQRRIELFSGPSSPPTPPTINPRTGIPLGRPEHQPLNRPNRNGRVYPDRIFESVAEGNRANEYTQSGNRATIGIGNGARERPDCFGDEHNSLKKCMTCAFEGLCERSFLEHAERRDRKRKAEKEKPKIPKNVMDSLPSRRLKLD